MPSTKQKSDGSLRKQRLVSEISGPTGPAGPDGAVGPAGATGPAGSTGSAGPQGVTGIQGVQGIQGIQGVQGVEGPTGIQGSQGSTGSQGATGTQGSTGAVGSQGITGIQGAQGNVGAQGVTGVRGITGTQGPQGAQGTQGATGQQGITGSQGVQGDQGQTGTQGATGLIGVTGSQGPAGATGVVGETGPQGATGAAGDQGPMGITGYQGLTGITGPQGAQGSQGSTGVQGSTGITGQQGVQGNQGNTGVMGGTGVTGYQGPIGITGAQGDPGPQGAQGSQGVQGITGAQGSVGPQGITGSQGVQGNTGVQGAVGPQGVTGLQGVQGTQGVQGIQGNQGITGAQGNQGIQGNTGVQGIQGITGVTGNQGVQGVTGPQGTTGVIGTTGSQGVAGNQGITGIEGTTGPRGITGAQGQQGVTGIQGSTGSQGATGILGVTGLQGPTGLMAEFLTHRLVLDSGGYIVQGKTGYGDPQEGIYIGNDGGVGKIYAGGTGTYFKYTGTGVESTGDFKTSATVGTTKGVHLDVANNELYFYGDVGAAEITVTGNISSGAKTITATSGTPFFSTHFQATRTCTVSGETGTYTISSINAAGTILTMAENFNATQTGAAITITLVASVQKLGSIGIIGGGGVDYTVGYFGHDYYQYAAVIGQSVGTVPSIIGLSGGFEDGSAKGGTALYGYSGDIDNWTWSDIFAQVGVQGFSQKGYGGYFECDATTGLSPILLEPSTSSSAPAHTARQGAIWITSLSNAYMNIDASTHWHCFSNQSLHDISQLAVTDSNIIVGNGSTWVAESGATARTSLGLGTGNTVDFTALHATTTLTDHIGEHTTSHNLILDNNTVLLNNNQLFGYTSGGAAKALIGLLSDDTIYVGYSTQNVNIANTATADNPIYMKVGGANSQNVTVGANDSAGAGYRILRVPNV